MFGVVAVLGSGTQFSYHSMEQETDILHCRHTELSYLYPLPPCHINTRVCVCGRGVIGITFFVRR